MDPEPMNIGEERRYVAYLLRLWVEPGADPAPWRASLQNPRSGERIGFAHPEDLIRYLRSLTGEPADHDTDAPGSGRTAT